MTVMMEGKNGRAAGSLLALEQGMTLVELMVGLVVAMVVTAAAFTMLITTQRPRKPTIKWLRRSKTHASQWICFLAISNWPDSA